MNIVENIWDSVHDSTKSMTKVKLFLDILMQKKLHSINEQDYSDSMVKSILKSNVSQLSATRLETSHLTHNSTWSCIY